MKAQYEVQCRNLAPLCPRRWLRSWSGNPHPSDGFWTNKAKAVGRARLVRFTKYPSLEYRVVRVVAGQKPDSLIRARASRVVREWPAHAVEVLFKKAS